MADIAIGPSIVTSEAAGESSLRLLALNASLAGALQRVDIELCYCSVFDDCWRPAENVTDGPRPVAQCPAFGDEQFLQ